MKTLDQIRKIFCDAIDKKTGQEQAAYLDEACRGNPSLRAEIDALLRAHYGQDELLSGPILGGPASPTETSISECAGTVIGRYKLLERIGEGGMAVVYMAEQAEPIRRRVALKIIKLGMDTKQVIARFEAERQALAMMDHPNIAKVLDAGATETGRPYFVMELVTGVSITEYCDKNKLSTRERLALFLQVCKAVQHAHQKGIIHRDIKPSNVMVAHHDGKPVPKVIDFGIAKATNQRLTEKTLFTRYAHIIGTPAYMSPEQAELSDLDIDTRSDIYSLGVLLYELLTGTPPFSEMQLRQAGYVEMQRVIREEEPVRPSTKLSTPSATLTDIAKQRGSTPELLRKTVQGDLDWIVMKALEKDRTRRYDTASALALDIEHHLKDEPVLAHAPGRIYCLRKFLRRHRNQVAGALALLVLFGAVIVILYMWKKNQHRHAEYQRQRTEIEASKHAKILVECREARAKGDSVNALAMVGLILNSPYVGPEAHLLHARLVSNLKLFDTTQKHDLTDTIRELESLLDERDEIAGQAHLLLAKLHYDNYPKAMERKETYRQKWEHHRQEAGRLLPRSADALQQQALSAGTADQAFDLLRQALELDEKHYDSLRERAYLYYVSHDYFNMLLDAVKMTGIQSRHALGYSLSAIAQRELNKFEGALQDHNRAIDLAPTAPEYYDQRRLTYLQMGRYEEALGDARRCIALNPGKSVYHYDVFCDLTALGRYDEARNEYEKFKASGVPAWHLGASAAKHVSDSLRAGRLWHPDGDPPEGPAFESMLTAEKQYHQWTAKKAQRVVGKGFSSDWSPDGNELAYCCGTFEATGIAIWNRQTGKTRLLTVPGGDPVWSPDGRYIAYLRNRQVLSAQDISAAQQGQSIDEHLDEIWLVKADGTEDPKFLVKGHWPEWSRRSNRLFFCPPRSVGKLCAISPDDADAKTSFFCPSDFVPAISPDEKYAACQQLGCVLIRELTSGKLVTEWVAPIGVQVYFLSWSPDGQALSVGVRGGGEGSAGLWIYDLSQERAKRVLSGACRSSSWSQPEVGQIAITRNYGNQLTEIWTAPTAIQESGQTLSAHIQGAIHYYTERIAAEPDNADNYARRAAHYVHLNDAQSAFADLEQYEGLVEDTNKKVQTYYDLGWRLSHMPQHRVNPEILVKLHHRAHVLNPAQPWVQGTLGIAYYRAGRWHDTINTIEKLEFIEPLELSNKTRDYYAFFPAMAYWQLGDRDQAQTWFERGVASMHRDTMNPEGSYKTPRCGYYMEAAELMGLKIKHFDRKPQVTGRQILPVQVRIDGNLDGTVANCINGMGLTDADMDGLPEHSEDPNHMWLRQKSTVGSLEFDLGQVYELGSMLVWNYNERGHTQKGIKSADISVWTAESGWQRVDNDLVFTEAEGSFDYDEPTYIQLNGVKAQKVRLNDMSNLGDENVLGLSEVQFFQKQDGDSQSTVETVKKKHSNPEAGFVFGEPINLGSINSEAVDSGPSLSADGLELYFQSDRLGGQGGGDIWVTTRHTTDSEWWSTPQNLGPAVNSPFGEGTPSISADGLTLFFGSNRPDGSGDFDLWMTTRKTKEDDWNAPINLGSTVNSPSLDDHPSISSDGLELYFTSSRDAWKIWVTRRPSTDALWGAPVCLDSLFRKGGSLWPNISADGLKLLFCSWRSGGQGSADIWITRRATLDSPWTEPKNLGATVNSSYREHEPCLSPDGSTLYLMSSRRGGLGNWDLWQVPVLRALNALEQGSDSASGMKGGGTSGK